MFSSNSINMVMVTVSILTYYINIVYSYIIANLTNFFQATGYFLNFNTLLDILEMVLETYFSFNYTTIILLYSELAIYNLKEPL